MLLMQHDMCIARKCMSLSNLILYIHEINTIECGSFIRKKHAVCLRYSKRHTIHFGIISVMLCYLHK